jgi:hypothetical protein
VQVRESNALAFVSAPTGASALAFGFGVSSSFRATPVDAVAPPRLPSPTPVSAFAAHKRHAPPLGLLASRFLARRRAVADGRAGTWSPAALGLANGVAADTHLPGDSSDEDVRGGNQFDRR